MLVRFSAGARVGFGAAVASGLLVVPVMVQACSVTSNITVKSKSGVAGVGLPGSAARISGDGFASTTVQLRWGKADGQLLATPMGAGFNADVTIPKVAPGLYYVYAMDGVGPIQWVSTPFRVTSPQAPGASPTVPTSTSTSMSSGDQAPASAPASSQSSGTGSDAAGGSAQSSALDPRGHGTASARPAARFISGDGVHVVAAATSGAPVAAGADGAPAASPLGAHGATSGVSADLWSGFGPAVVSGRQGSTSRAASIGTNFVEFAVGGLLVAAGLLLAVALVPLRRKARATAGR